MPYGAEGIFYKQLTFLLGGVVLLYNEVFKYLFKADSPNTFNVSQHLKTKGPFAQMNPHKTTSYVFQALNNYPTSCTISRNLSKPSTMETNALDFTLGVGHS